MRFRIAERWKQIVLHDCEEFTERRERRRQARPCVRMLAQTTSHAVGFGTR
jgi:hypothetical protein